MGPAALAARLGIGSAAALLRACDRATANRPAAAALFWTLGPQQVGKAALHGWRHLLLPGLDGGRRFRLWPFDGALCGLLAPGAVVVCETYPAECRRQLGLKSAGSKRRQADRASLAEPLRGTMRRLGAFAHPELAAAIACGFGGDAAGEDRLDSLVGLLGLLNVLAGQQPDQVPADPWIRSWEGWILGQTPAAE